jgi:ABC-2 type transport system permease protein
MISKPLLKQIIHSNLKLFLIFTGVLCLLISLLMIVYTPGLGATLIDFAGIHFFVMLAPIFSMIYIIIIGTRMIAGQVDKGSMGYTLSSPVTRTQVTFTNALFLTGSLVLMYTLIAVVGIGIGAIVHPGELDNGAIIGLSLGAFALQFAISGIVFCASCVFNRSSRSLIFGAGLPIIFYAANLLVTVSSSLAFFKYFSLLTLYDAKAIISGQSYILSFFILAGMAVIIYAAGIKVFKEKDLPL